ncbi:methylated-DNA--[protein]-cysteine S-methyltransferase [Pseudodesulfovibrio sp.]|uniref:methylated-DNA--[protein]-cysteine S-methyltransferase n=1 Tax=Pseudodesulfovibrio sp. TaxID=2035812 RepID=UPI0026169B70|nr:methylated-DNA--[protein]-cysteine S-methyltransferase [Pseudodesulfovibrio sp.]MDD3312287.1 methylated-DNA--[protein]-cysteine S-methyltransferase [Pseudodesulfovibrio sp.]
MPVHRPTLRHAAVTTRFGLLLAAFSDRGLVSLEPGDDAAALLRSLAERFPGATLSDDAPGLREPLAAIAAFIDDPARPLGIALDPQGTPFQREVWRALTAIPAGQTRTYSQVAEAVGRPSAVRAVASAVGANRLAVIVPCHRVVRKDGGLGGFRWGVGRKAALLQAEGVKA